MRLLSLALAATLLATAVQAQGVAVAPLSAPDIFSGGSRDTGLPDDLWKGSSADLARRVIPTLGAKPLSPAATTLAIRLLSTGANAPTGAENDRALAAARGQALLALGDPAAANASVERIPNLAAEPALAQIAAEAALLTAADDRACRIEAALTASRGELYWLRLRSFCQAIAGQPDAAQLSLTLANEKTRDPVFTRLMTALLLSGDPGAPSARNGLETALSRRLGILPATAAPVSDPPPPPELMQTDPVRAARLFVRAGDLAQARIIRGALTQDAVPGARAVDLDLLDALIAAASGEAPAAVQDALVTRGGTTPKSPAQAAALYLAALGAPMDDEARDAFAGFDVGKSAVSPARLAALDIAADTGLKGETALIALTIAADAGIAGPAPADRAAIIRALRRAGLGADARAFAVEGILALSPK